MPTKTSFNSPDHTKGSSINGQYANSSTIDSPQVTSEVNASFLRAARAGNIEKVLEFLNDNIEINVSNSNGLNALHLSSKEGHVEVVRELLERNAFVDAATKKGNTALHISSLAGQQLVVELLVKFGANVDCRSQNGFTPLYMAAQENHIEVVKFLLGNNANQSLATEDGFTPLAVALQQGHEKVVAILLENDSKGKIRLPALHIAAKKNDVKAAALLLNNDPNMDLSPEARMVNCTTKSGFTPLHIAAHYGNAEIAKFLISKGADVNFEARQNITPLHVATKWGKANSVNLLLDSGAKIDVKTRDGLTPLHCAARSGHDQIVELLFARGAPINAKTKNGLTSLHMAAQGDHVEAARILLYHSSKLVDQTTCDYLTALHVAAHCGHVKIAKLLLDSKADVNSRALNGFTPLHIACKKNRIKVIELLIKNGASKEATTESGLTPLHVASFMGCMNVVTFLIQHGSQPNVPTIRGETPLHLASRANQTDIVRILLRHGATVDAKAKEQQTPLHIATRLGNTDIIALLLRHGAFVDAATSDGYTALHIASKEGQEEVASILFENGASLNVTTKKGFTPLHISSKYGNIKVASLLLQRNAQPDIQGKNGLTPLHVATHYNRPSVAHLLLQHGASPHIVAKNGYSALHIAAKKNQMDIATTLLEYQAKTNCESNAGFTPLHLACQEGHIDMASLLLTHHAEPGSASKNGLTPLHLCAQEDKVNCAAILVKSGAGIDPQTKAGYTPLHVACHFGQINMVKFLLQHQADVNVVTKKHGFTSLHCAAQQGHVPIVKLLLEHGASPDITNNNGQTPLAIAQRLGYLSVIEELRLVTQTTLVSTTIKTTEEKYKVQTPETMQETFMSDSEDELGDDMYHGDEQYKYLTNEGDLNNAHDDSIALTPKTPKKEDAKLVVASPLSPVEIQQQPPVVEPKVEITNLNSISNNNLTVQSTTGGKKIAGSLGNMSMAESMDGSFYGGYQSSKNVNLHADNIPIEARPKNAGFHLQMQSFTNLTHSYAKSTDFSIFTSNSSLTSTMNSHRDFLISFMVDARGGAMKGCRHSGVRVIIPPRRASMPTRITCRFVRKEKLSVAPPLNESESLAARVLEMGPTGCKFLGPVVLEIPHYASLRGKEREIMILRNDNGDKWYEHPILASESAIEEALGCTLELGATSEDGQSNGGHNEDNLSQYSAKMRITRILTNDFPKYFALVSRIRHETHAVSEVGGVISSTIIPKAQAVFPEKALQKKIKLSLQAMPIQHELVAKMFGNRVAVSPIVTIEPRRRKFHKAITLTIPLPKSPLKGMINNYSHNNDSFSLRLLCSITGGLAPAQWEDITGHTPLSYVDECVSFTTTVSARFWLMDCQNVSEATKMATELYREAIAVPFMSRFIVYGKRSDITEARLRVYCITDDREEKALEVRENFLTIAKSKEVEVLENRAQYLEIAGNILPVIKSNGEQLSMNFMAFYENRLPFIVKVKDLDQNPVTGRLVFLKDAKNAQIKSDVRSPPVCTLDIQLPQFDKDQIEHDEIKKRSTVERGMKLAFFNSTGSLSSKALSTNVLYKENEKVEFNIRLLANDLANAEKPFDWLTLAQKLDLNAEEIEKIRNSSSNSPYLMSSSPANQAYDMLFYWVNKYNDAHVDDETDHHSAGEIIQKALKDLNIDEDIINRNISSYSNVPNSSSIHEKAENIISVEKSFAKLNTNSNIEIPMEDRDITKESESCAEEETDDQKNSVRSDKKAYINTSYCNKVNAEYEAIKKNILQLNESKAIKSTLSDTSESGIPNIDAKEKINTEPVVYKFEDLEISEPKIQHKSDFSQILKQVERCTSQAEQLERLDEVDAGFSYSVIDNKDAEMVKSNEVTCQPKVNSVQIEDVFPTKSQDSENPETNEFIPFYQVSEELLIEESYNLKKDKLKQDEEPEKIVKCEKQFTWSLLVDGSDTPTGQTEAVITQKSSDETTHVEIELNKERNFTFNEEYAAEEDLKNKLVLELNNENYDNELENIEQQSPILERELQNTEYELQNFKSRLAMTETVSAVTQSVLDSIRNEYNIEDNCPEAEAKVPQLEEYFDENNQPPTSSSNENIHHEYEAEEVAGIIDENQEDIIGLIKTEIKEKCNESLENFQEAMEKKTAKIIEDFQRQSLNKIDNISMVQSSEITNLLENEPSSSAAENESLMTNEDRKISISQTNLIDNNDYSENDSFFTEEKVAKSTEIDSIEKQMKQNTTLYQTFDSSSSESETEQDKAFADQNQKKKSIKKVKIEGIAEDKLPEILYSSGEVSSESLQDLIESNKNYISDSSVAEEPAKPVDTSLEYGNLLSVSSAKIVVGSESREFLLQDDDDESHKVKALNESIQEITQTEDLVSIQSKIERESSDLSNKSIIKEFTNLEKNTHSDLDVSTDNEAVYTSSHRPSFKHEQIETVTGIEATNLIISSSSTSCSSVVEKIYQQEPKEGSIDVSIDEKESVELLDSSLDELETRSKSLNYLESLVVNSSSNEVSVNKDEEEGNLNDEALFQVKNSQSLNLKKCRPDSFKTHLSGDNNNDYLIPSDDQYEEKTPTAGGFFDQQVTSSNEPSIDQLNMMDQSKEEITAIATAYLFSSTVQSDYDLNAVDTAANETPQDNAVTSSNESIVVNEAYDDTEDQNLLRSKINTQQNQTNEIVEETEETEEFNIDEKTFLIATPTSSMQSPQVEQQISFHDSLETEMEQYSRNDHLEKIEQAISIVEHTLERSFNLIADIVDESSLSKVENVEESIKVLDLDQTVVQTITNIEKSILENETNSVETDKVAANSIISAVIEEAKEICAKNEKSLTKIDSEKHITFSESTEDLLLSSNESSHNEIVKLLEEEAPQALNLMTESKIFVESVVEEAKKKLAEQDEPEDLVQIEIKSVVEKAIEHAKTICESNERAIDKAESTEANGVIDEEYQAIKMETKAQLEEVNNLHEAIEEAKSICNENEKSLTKIDSEKNMTFSESTEDLLVSSSESSNDELVKLAAEDAPQASNLFAQSKVCVVEEDLVQLESQSVVEKAIQQAKDICEENERTLKGEIKTQVEKIIEHAQSICDESYKVNATPPVSPMEITPSESGEDLDTKADVKEFIENILEVSRDKLESYDVSKSFDETIDFTGVSQLSEKPDIELVKEEEETDQLLQTQSKNMIETVLSKAKEICEENANVLILAETKGLIENILEKAQEKLQEDESESFVTELIDNAKQICEENEIKIEESILNEENEDEEEKKKKKKRQNSQEPEIFKDEKRDSDDDDNDDMNGDGDLNKVSMQKQTTTNEQTTSEQQTNTTSTDKKGDQDEVESPEQFNSLLNTQPMLTSSFMSESGNLPEPSKLLSSFDLCDQTLTIDEVSNSDSEEDSSNRTIDIDIVAKQSNDTTQDLNTSSASFHTAIESISNNKNNAAINSLGSKRSSTSNSYMTAQEEFSIKASFDASTTNTTNDSFHTAIGDMSNASRGNFSSTYSSNASYNTGSQSFNSTLADLSTDSINLNESNTNDELGQFNVQSFLNMYPNKTDTKPKSETTSSLNSTLTDDGTEALHKQQKPKVESQLIEETESFAIITKEEANEDFVITETPQEKEQFEDEDELTSANGSMDDISVKKNRMNLLLTPSASNSSSSSPSSTSSSMTKDLIKRQCNKPNEPFGDNVSCTSSVLEFEKLEMQCSTESFEEKAQDCYMKPRRSKNLELEAADEEESISCLNDDEEFEEEESLNLIRKNFEICHDLNTIYESFENDVKEVSSSNSPRKDSISKSNENLVAAQLNIQKEDEHKSLKTSTQLAKSLTKISPQFLEGQKSNLNLELSRSSSSCSVKSNDSFENELKCKVKIDGASFFGKKNNILKKPTVPPPEVPQVKQPESEKISSLLTAEDSGQSSMTESVNSAFHSQLQSPNPDDSNNTVNMCLITQNPLIISDYEKKNIDEKFINDLKKSMARGQKSSKLPLSQSSSSSRQSRTSSSASSSSSTSLNDSSSRATIHVLQSSQFNAKKSFQPHVSAESLPSFRKGCNSLQSEEVSKKLTSSLVTSSSFNSNIENKANQGTLKVKKANVSNPNISSHHSSNCYCGKHSPVMRLTTLNDKSMSSKSTPKGSESGNITAKQTE